jgi:hypothetical protein
MGSGRDRAMAVAGVGAGARAGANTLVRGISDTEKKFYDISTRLGSSKSVMSKGML